MYLKIGILNLMHPKANEIFNCYTFLGFRSIKTETEAIFSGFLRILMVSNGSLETKATYDDGLNDVRDVSHDVSHDANRDENRDEEVHMCLLALNGGGFRYANVHVLK